MVLEPIRVCYLISRHLEVRKNIRLCLVISTHFSVFGNWMKHSSPFAILHQTRGRMFHPIFKHREVMRSFFNQLLF